MRRLTEIVGLLIFLKGAMSMASRDIDINMNVTFWGDGILLETAQKTLTKSEMADKLNYKYGVLPTFAKNKNYGYSTDKEN